MFVRRSPETYKDSLPGVATQYQKSETLGCGRGSHERCTVTRDSPAELVTPYEFIPPRSQDPRPHPSQIQSPCREGMMFHGSFSIDRKLQKAAFCAQLAEQLTFLFVHPL
eukprot:2771620-Rhodomonas_salina.1